jgi:hypothetical protein
MLHLEDNSLSVLPPGVFQGLPNLRRLYLQENNLTAEGLPQQVFAGLPSMTVLHLHRNPLRCAPVAVNSTLLDFTGPPACPQGCPIGTYVCYANNTKQGDACPELCSACPAGTYSASHGATTKDTCIACGAGTYSLAGASSCLSCQANSDAPPKSRSPTACTCNAGFSGADGQECTACVGSWKDEAGSSPCIECGLGKYSFELARTSPSTCRVCPNNSYTTTMGSISIEDCMCNGGFTGASGNCIACIEGKYKDSSGNATCTQCNANSNSPAASNSFAHCSCNAGFTGQPGNCTMCPVGTYKTTQDNATCSRCPINSFTTSSASVFATDCVCNAGYTARQNGIECAPCPGLLS